MITTAENYEDLTVKLIASEKDITNVFMFPAKTSITYASLFGMGVGRRAVALSSGFREMVKQCNSICAMPIVRMQLDTALRFYAGFFVENHQTFCRDVIEGKQINKIKSDEGILMLDKYLVNRLATRNPWMTSVYNNTSGYIHFSNKHIKEVIRIDEEGKGQMIIGPTDYDREPMHFLEPMQCMLHLNLIIHFALKDWFARMCDSDGIKVSAGDLWNVKSA